MPYKLVILQPDGSLLTGQPLADHLTAIGFSVPPKFNYVPQEPLPLITDTTEYHENMEAWREEYLRVYNLNAANLQAYFNQYKDFGVVLQSIFLLATRVKDGNLPDGRPNYTLKLLPARYTFEQAAQVLMGYVKPAPADPIHFIANNYFG